MNKALTFGIIVGLLVGIVLVWLLLAATKTDGAMKCKYDERQVRTKGQAFKYGFFTLIIYNFAYGTIELCLEKTLMESFTAMMAGNVIAIVVYVSYCIWHECYFALNENPKRVIIVFTIICFVNILISIGAGMRGELIENGVLTFRCMNPLCAALMIIIMAEIFVKSRQDRKEDE